MNILLALLVGFFVNWSTLDFTDDKKVVTLSVPPMGWIFIGVAVWGFLMGRLL